MLICKSQLSELVDVGADIHTYLAACLNLWEHSANNIQLAVCKRSQLACVMLCYFECFCKLVTLRCYPHLVVAFDASRSLNCQWEGALMTAHRSKLFRSDNIVTAASFALRGLYNTCVDCMSSLYVFGLKQFLVP